jgi:hypothetical protein
MKSLKFAGILMFFLGLGSINQSFAQTTTWLYDAADNSGWVVQVTTNSSGTVTKFEFQKKGDAAWQPATIESTNEYANSYRVKSAGSGKVYGYVIDWANDKMTETSPDGKEVVYWLRKS